MDHFKRLVFNYENWIDCEPNENRIHSELNEFKLQSELKNGNYRRMTNRLAQELQPNGCLDRPWTSHLARSTQQCRPWWDSVLHRPFFKWPEMLTANETQSQWNLVQTMKKKKCLRSYLLVHETEQLVQFIPFNTGLTERLLQRFPFCLFSIICMCVRVFVFLCECVLLHKKAFLPHKWNI